MLTEIDIKIKMTLKYKQLGVEIQKEMKNWPENIQIKKNIWN